MTLPRAETGNQVLKGGGGGVEGGGRGLGLGLGQCYRLYVNAAAL